MIVYANSKKQAEKIAKQMKIEEPDYANDVQIAPTVEESFGIFKEVKKGKYVIYNETE